MLTDGLILGLLASLGLTILGYKMKSLPVLFVAALGWMASALMIYQQTQEVFPMILFIMVAFSVFFLVSSKKGD